MRREDITGDSEVMLALQFAGDRLRLMVRHLPSVPLTDYRTLPNVSAVYMILDEKGRALYVGASRWLANRWATHPQRKLSEANRLRIAWIETELAELSEREQLFILALQPTLNGQFRLDRSPSPYRARKQAATK